MSTKGSANCVSYFSRPRVEQAWQEGVSNACQISAQLPATERVGSVQPELEPFAGMAHLPSSIPGAWISSTELDNPSPFTSSPPGPALLSGFLSKSNGSPSSALPALSKSSMNHLDRVVQFHRRLSTALFPQESPKSVRKGSRLLKTYKSSVIGTPQVTVPED